MRVLYVMPGLEENGGVRNAMQVAEVLSPLGVDVTVFSVRSPLEAALDPARVTRPVKFGSDIPIRLRRNPRVLSRLYAASRGCDLIVSTYELGLGLMAAAAGAAIARRPAVVWVQSNLVESMPRVPKRDQAAAKFLYPRFQGVLLANPDLRATLGPVSTRPLRCIGSAENGIDIAAVRAAARTPTAIDLAGAPIVVAVGRLSQVKGLDILLRAHALVLASGRPHRVMLVGEGEDRPGLEALVRELGVQETTTFVGHLDNPQAVVSRAALYCLPSRFEGHPLALLEAIALGAPTVAADCLAGPRRILRDGAYGELVPPESPEALARAIARHLDEPTRLQCMAAEGARWAEQFTVAHCAERHHAFYMEVLAAHRSRPALMRRRGWRTRHA